MRQDEMAEVMERVFEECRALRAAGQREYARTLDNAFANFERVGERVKVCCPNCSTTFGIGRKAALLVYLEKHMDGIHAWASGHTSQREAVSGRTNDATVYLALLRGMAEEEALRGPAKPSADAVSGMRPVLVERGIDDLLDSRTEPVGRLGGIIMQSKMQSKRDGPIGSYASDGTPVANPDFNSKPTTREAYDGRPLGERGLK